MKQHTFGQSYKETIQEEIDAINEMPLWIAYLVPLDSLGKVIEDEYMEFNQIHSYKILDDGQIKNSNILFTMYFDSDNKIRKVFKRWADGEHCIVLHIIILMGDWYMEYIIKAMKLTESCMLMLRVFT